VPLRKIALGLVLTAIGLCASRAVEAHDPHAYGHPNPWGYYHGYPSYGGEYWLRHHHHYVYRPHYWHWHPDVHGYLYNGWGGDHGYGGGPYMGGAPSGPLFYEGSAPTTGTPDPFADDLPEIPELP
jgi:hypothetical protein